jgi:hypothetical protein
MNFLVRGGEADFFGRGAAARGGLGQHDHLSMPAIAAGQCPDCDRCEKMRAAPARRAWPQPGRG